MSVYDKTYIKAKVRKFDDKIKTNFLDNEVLKENMCCTYIACITINSVLKIGKKLLLFFIHTLWVLTDMLGNKKLNTAIILNDN